MSEAQIVPAGSDPFTVRTALALVVFGSLMFVALLWMIGNGFAEGDANNGGAHAEGRGLNGYAALAQLLEQRGHTVRRTRSDAAYAQPGLLILTPLPQTKGSEIEAAVRRHRRFGPTLVITPKWVAVPVSSAEVGVKRGWVRLAGGVGPNWPGFLDQVRVDLSRGGPGAKPVRWFTRRIAGRFPEPGLVMAGSGPGLIPLVAGEHGEVFAAYLDDGRYPALAAMAPIAGASAAVPNADDDDEDAEPYPLVIVFDPDLLDNYGMSASPSAVLAETLVNATAGRQGAITFDLTLAGLERKASLLTLAFTPPFLAATLCLLLAAGAVGWRAFLRFGPPQEQGRAIAFGKRALVGNAAGLIVRSRRYHLLGAPFANAARQRLVRAFALPRDAGDAAHAIALDRAAAAAGAGDHAFSQAVARLEQARNQRDLVKAAADLHALERTLTR